MAIMVANSMELAIKRSIDTVPRHVLPKVETITMLRRSNVILLEPIIESQCTMKHNMTALERTRNDSNL
eukprot:4713088-Amphidinium_carterae.1